MVPIGALAAKVDNERRIRTGAEACIMGVSLIDVESKRQSSGGGRATE